MAKKGGSWQGRLYIYDHDTDRYFSKDDYSFGQGIIKIWQKKGKLSAGQVTQLILNHQFIVLETGSWWWSIEKDSEGILIQRSIQLEDVEEKFITEPRAPPILDLKSAKGRPGSGMNDVVNYVYNNNELSKTYNVVLENCKHFATRIFNGFSDPTSVQIHNL
jgi:hypothetical protein